MATEIKMPQLSDTMSEGKILTWNKQEGEEVSRGDILAEVETDKANLEIECFHPGTLLKIVVPADKEAKVGETIAWIGEEGESVNGSSTHSAPSSASPSTDSSDTSEQSNKEIEKKSSDRTSAIPTKSHSTGSKNGSQGSSSGGERLKISPLARKMAEQAGINPSEINGTGPEGRIIRKDIEDFLAHQGSTQSSHQPKDSTSKVQTANPTAHTADRASNNKSSTEQSGGTYTQLTKMRKTIAERMQQSVTEAPHFYTTVSIDMGQCLALQSSLRKLEGFEKLSINHLIIKACSLALKEVPSVNCSYRDGQIYEPISVNIGMITALEGGLIIPVLHTVNEMSLRDVVFEARAAIDRARAGRPTSSDLTGGTFSISNMGMFDVENFTAIISPGQGAVLAVSSTKDQPIVKDGQITIASIMKVTLSVDHRIIDGVMAAEFLAALKKVLENPVILCLSS